MICGKQTFDFWITSGIGNSGRKCCVLTSIRVYLIQKSLPGEQGSSPPALSPDPFSTARAISCILQNIEETQNVPNEQCLWEGRVHQCRGQRACVHLQPPHYHAPSLRMDGSVHSMEKESEFTLSWFCHDPEMLSRLPWEATWLCEFYPMQRQSL